jgi:16S rRNA (adenine1518-N6/adenine1519-N6)-dimethyltransferase
VHLFDLGPHAFRPAPKVHSSVVRLLPRPAGRPRARDDRAFADVVQAAFAQRRKMLRNTLRGLFDEARLEALGIDPAARAETLEVADFIRLADARPAVPPVTGPAGAHRIP